jgi:hypothetical protein
MMTFLVKILSRQGEDERLQGFLCPSAFSVMVTESNVPYDSAERSAGAFDIAPLVGMSGVVADVLARSSCVLHGCMSGCVSSRKKHAATMEANRRKAQRRLGRR